MPLAIAGGIGQRVGWNMEDDMRIMDKMTTEESLAKEHGWHLVNWDAAYEEARNRLFAEALNDVAFHDDWLNGQITKSVNDALTNAWIEGMSHMEWVSAALLTMRGTVATRDE